MRISDWSSDVCSSDLAGQSRLARLLVGAVPLPLGHQFRSALQPLFGLDHVARREPIIAAPVLAEFDQVWRTANRAHRSEEHTSELQSLMRNSYAVFCLKKKNK